VIEVEATVKATPESVWRVLADGWLYPLWVVGASRIRQVDDMWPEAGSKIHHSVGLWPAVINDDTEVIECLPGSVIGLRAKAWPAGEATVRVRLEPQGADTRVRMQEDATAGPARLVPKRVLAPMVVMRNREALRRLAWLSERRG
jgi:Polyketide cyclase / dehydrase and lipid transport